jgi:hypothetical protein
MKLGKETGSPVNALMAGKASGEIAAGTPATIIHWSDRKPSTVISVDEKGIISVQEDTYEVISGSTHDGSAEYEYTRNPNGTIHYYKKDKSGRFIKVEKGESNRWKKIGSGYVFFGLRERYYDPNF